MEQAENLLRWCISPLTPAFWRKGQKICGCGV